MTIYNDKLWEDIVRIKYLNKLVEILKKKEIDAILIAPSEEMEFIMGQLI